jgi:hypothetical protein
MEEFKKQFENKLKGISTENRLAISSFDWIKKVEEISKEYLLTEEEILELIEETSRVLLGENDLDTYTFNIEYNTGLSEKKSIELSSLVFEKVFMPISKIIESSLEEDKDIPTPKYKEETIPKAPYAGLDSKEDDIPLPPKKEIQQNIVKEKQATKEEIKEEPKEKLVYKEEVLNLNEMGQKVSEDIKKDTLVGEEKDVDLVVSNNETDPKDLIDLDTTPENKIPEKNNGMDLLKNKLSEISKADPIKNDYSNISTDEKLNDYIEAKPKSYSKTQDPYKEEI